MMRLYGLWDRLRRSFGGLADQPAFRAAGLSGVGPLLPVSNGAVQPLERTAQELRAARGTAQKAAALRLFNPSQPVEDRRHLLGRQTELGQLTRALIEMEMHAIIHGARGAGKTSLARAFGDHADERGHIVLYASCSDDCGFTDLFSPYLDELQEALPRELALDLRDGRAAIGERLGPRELCALLTRIGGYRAVMIVDEFDRIANPATRAAVATLLKLLSDARASVRLLIVGIAQDMSGLIDAHASLRRHLMAVPLRGFDDQSAADLFDRGEAAIGIAFSAEVRARIASLAAGSPYHLRLFCYAIVLAAIEREEVRISAAALEAGLRDSFSIWAGSSPAAASLFMGLARVGDPQRAALRAIAVQALAATPPNRVQGGSDPQIVAALQPALVRSNGDVLVFEDSLAPQFLLLACFLASNERSTLHGGSETVGSRLAALHEVKP